MQGLGCSFQDPLFKVEALDRFAVLGFHERYRGMFACFALSQTTGVLVPT